MSSPSSLPSGASAAALAALLLATPLAGGARAADRVVVHPSLVVSEWWESNPLSREHGTPSDTVTRVQPALRLSSEGEAGYTRISVGANARVHAELRDLNTIDPYARFDVNRRFSERWALFGDGSFSSREELDPIDEGGELLQGGRPDVDELDWTGGLRFLLDPRSSLALSLSRSDREFGADAALEQRLRDSDSGSWALVYSHLLTPLDELTLGYTLRDSAFGSMAQQGATVGSARSGIDEDMQLLSLVWARSWSPTWRSRLTSGVRRLSSEGNDITFFRRLDEGPDDELALDESSSAFVGGLTLTRATERSQLDVGFSVETRPSTGQSGSLDVQSFSVAYARRLNDRVTFSISGALSDMESASESFALRIVEPTISPELREALMLTPEQEQALIRALTANELAACSARGGVPGLAGTGVFRFGEAEFLVGARRVCAELAEGEVDTRVRRLGMRLTWKLRKGLTAVLGYDLRRQSASGRVGGDYTDHRLGVRFRWGFDLDVP